MFDFESSIIIQDEFWDKDHWDKWGEYKGIFASVSIAYGDFGKCKYRVKWEADSDTIHALYTNSFAKAFSQYMEWRNYAKYVEYWKD